MDKQGTKDVSASKKKKSVDGQDGDGRPVLNSSE
jgi:hypothetical protein